MLILIQINVAEWKVEHFINGEKRSLDCLAERFHHEMFFEHERLSIAERRLSPSPHVFQHSLSTAWQYCYAVEFCLRPAAWFSRSLVEVA
jgi:hypothetical protein